MALKVSGRGSIPPFIVMDVVRANPANGLTRSEPNRLLDRERMTC